MLVILVFTNRLSSLGAARTIDGVGVIKSIAIAVQGACPYSFSVGGAEFARRATVPEFMLRALPFVDNA